MEFYAYWKVIKWIWLLAEPLLILPHWLVVKVGWVRKAGAINSCKNYNFEGWEKIHFVLFLKLHNFRFKKWRLFNMMSITKCEIINCRHLFEFLDWRHMLSKILKVTRNWVCFRWSKHVISIWLFSVDFKIITFLSICAELLSYSLNIYTLNCFLIRMPLEVWLDIRYFKFFKHLLFPLIL
jgi:hypothetical protein